MKAAAFALLIIASAPPLAAQAPRVSASLPAAELRAIETLRHDIWTHWYAGDTAALRRELAPDLVAISPDAPHFVSRDETIAEAARYHATGATLGKILFDGTTVHRFGDAVVLFSRYSVVTTAGGVQSTQRGRATEVFVRTGGRWVQSSWHLDVIS